MENIEQNHNPSSYKLRTIQGDANEGYYVICLARKGMQTNTKYFLEYIKANDASFIGCYTVSQSLSRFGYIDALAADPAMQDFMKHVYDLEIKEAQAYFHEYTRWIAEDKQEIRLVHKKLEWQRLVNNIKPECKEILLIEPVKAP